MQLEGACFVAGTPLLTPGGSKLIEQFRVGDAILSRSEFDPTGPIEAKVVEEVFVRTGRVAHLHAGGEVIGTTLEHPFFEAERGWVQANELHPGDRIATLSGEWVRVEEVYDTGEWAVVYNLRIADHHTYFVGCEEWGFAVWAHNTCQDFADIARERITFNQQDPQHVARVRTESPASTVAKLVVAGQTYYGRNTWAGSDVRVAQLFRDAGFLNPTDSTKIASNVATANHAEGHVFYQAFIANNMTRYNDVEASLFVDQSLCGACDAQGGIRSLMRALGVKILNVEFMNATGEIVERAPFKV